MRWKMKVGMPWINFAFEVARERDVKRVMENKHAYVWHVLFEMSKTFLPSCYQMPYVCLLHCAFLRIVVVACTTFGDCLSFLLGHKALLHLLENAVTGMRQWHCSKVVPTEQVWKVIVVWHHKNSGKLSIVCHIWFNRSLLSLDILHYVDYFVSL